MAMLPMQDACDTVSSAFALLGLLLLVSPLGLLPAQLPLPEGHFRTLQVEIEHKIA